MKNSWRSPNAENAAISSSTWPVLRQRVERVVAAADAATPGTYTGKSKYLNGEHKFFARDA